ncbi:CGI-121-domain-containing protein [Corynespora cassiicola Philippines]|uniref:EKC/KEOPS complex subunit CGI121 n=1 Tax=Corynespora cassiicola Philippines TaxID=1448308 RepID=A0A2T2NI78_CORCC|nr:CGI-121-domain-containing protein [Corynespora cassiicola Philippines]
MASVHSFRLPHYPDHPVQIAAFTNVENAAFLRSQLLAANPDFDYAFLDATMILSPAHLLAATFLALHSHLTSRAKTRTPHSELVFRLHPNNNIGESYRRFGIADDTAHLIAVKLSLTPDVTRESVARHLGDVVRGQSVPLEDDGAEVLGSWCDVAKVRKIYKLNDMGAAKGGAKAKGKAAVNGLQGGIDDEKKQLESVILGMITLKGS